jgi:hypothetical protein
MATSPKAQQHHSPPPQVLDQNASAAEGELQDSVQRTCSGACALRAVELLRSPKDAILRDELALRMAGPRMVSQEGGSPGSSQGSACPMPALAAAGAGSRDQYICEY